MLEVSWFVCNTIYFLLFCYLFCHLILNIDFMITKKIIFFSVITGMLYILFEYLDLIYIRPYIIYVYLIITFKFIYKQSILKILIGLFSIIFLLIISELIYDFFVVFLLKQNLAEMSIIPICNLMSNLLIFTICMIISSIKIVKRFVGNIIKWYNSNELKSLIFFVILFLIIATFILYNNFIKLLPSSFLFLTNMFCIAVFVFVIGFFKEKSNNNRIIAEYDQLLEYVKNYEKLIETKSKNQHEYKNQLILIQGMIKNKEAISYIDEVLKNEKEDQNVELLKKLQYLPQGGLKGLIYYKIEKMIDKKIDVYVDIASNLKNTKVLKDNLQDISKIIGVYLDNAIEAVEKADKKYIIIESYIEDVNIVFSFSNTYKGNIDLNKVDKEGYTTKGEGKGYGLSLVRDIIEKNNKFSQKRELNGIYYVQKLYIKK